MTDTKPQRSRILVVDDDPSILDLLCGFLKEEYHVSVATSGEQALALCREQPPDLVLLDLMMPGPDGYAVCRRLKSSAATSDIPIIFVTARDEVDAEIMALEAGAVDFLPKPVHRAVVLARIRTHIALRLQAKKLREMAMTDILTGVANRRLIEEQLEAEWRRCRRNQVPLSVIMIDIDHFKLYNDSYGHAAGDNCLQHVADALNSRIRRAGDLLGRYGGEEFICVLPQTTVVAAVEIADELGRAVEGLNVIHGQPPAGPIVTISRGIATIVPSTDAELTDLVEVADAMLYEAKRYGRNCTRSCSLGPAEPRATGSRA